MNKEAMYKLSYGLFVLTAKEGKKDNGCIINTAIQAASAPNQLSICINKANATHDMIVNTGKFTVSVLSQAADFELFKRFGFQSGRDVDKFAECHLTRETAEHVSAPMIAESPVNIECVVEQVIPLGSHDMFLAKVVAVNVDEQYMDEKGKFQLAKANPIVYSHGEYYDLGDFIGTFGYSVRKPKKVDVTKSEKNSQKTMDRNLSKQSGEKAASRTAKKKKTSGKTRNKKKK
mgnify:CR=1 FL=1